MNLSNNAKKLLDTRYRQKTPDGTFTETHEDIFKRVADNIASVEKDATYWEEVFFKEMTSQNWIPNTPTLCNAGTNNGLAYNACYTWGLEDTIISDKMGPFVKNNIQNFEGNPFGITDAVTACALITKTGGGIGYTLDRLRPTGDWISTSKSESGGPIGFWHVLAAMSAAMQQGGKRRGANMMTMSLWHPDILKFITAKDEFDPWMTEVLGYEGEARRFANFNISVKIYDYDMHVINDDPDRIFVVSNPRTGKLYTIPKTVNIKNYQLSDLIEMGHDAGIPHYNHEILTSKKYLNSYTYGDIWQMIIERAHGHADPGILFWDRVNERRVLPSHIPIETTNPCITGDTLVAVADGRGNISIKQLAEEGLDVPVFCLNDNGKVVVRKMRNPRITGYNEKLLEIEIENGHKIKCTHNHKLMINGRSYVQAKDLKIGDSLFIMNKNIAKFREVSHGLKHGPAGDYIWISTSDRETKRAEHRIIYESLIGKIPKGHIIHHKDYNSLNNEIENLACMSSQDHDALHAKDMIGDKNPMRRAKHEWSQEKWEEYSKNMSNAVSGLKNGRAHDISNFQIRKFALELTKKLGRRFSSNEWQIEAEKVGIPTQFSKFRSDELGTPFELSYWASLTCGFEGTNLHIKTLKNLKEAQFQGYKTRIENQTILVERTCEHCKNTYEISFQKREQSYCSVKCSSEHVPYEKRILGLQKAKETFENRKELLRNKQIEIYRTLNNPDKKQWIKACKDNNISFEVSRKSSPFRYWEDLKEAAKNHKILAIREIESEDVYNGTVDDFHNFFIGGFEESPRFGTKQYLYINNRQCGEQALEPGGVCNLGSINLANFVNEDGRIMWKELLESWRNLIRFLDNVIDATPYPMHYISQNAKNWRRIGPGIMGLADMFFKLHIRYGSQESYDLCKEISEKLYNEALQYSILLGNEKGNYPGDPKATRRNSYFTTIAPTGSISMVAECSGGIEPLYSLALKRQVLRDHTGKAADTEIEVNKYLKKYLDKYLPLSSKYILDYCSDNGGKLGDIDFSNIIYLALNDKATNISDIELELNSVGLEHLRHIFITTMELTWEQHLDIQEIWTKYFCPPNGGNSISKTVNMPHDVTQADVDRLYKLAWEKRCIGITMYRDGSHKGQPMTTNKKESVEEVVPVDMPIEEVVKQPSTIGQFETKPATIIKSRTSMGNLRLVVGFDDNKPTETFIIASKQGTDVSSMCDALGRTISIALQSGVPVDKLTDSISNISGGSSSMYNGITIKSIPDGIAQMLKSAKNSQTQRIILSNVKQITEVPSIEKDDPNYTGDCCPDCGEQLVFESGCRGGICKSCGFSKC